MKLIDQFRKILALDEYHVVVEKQEIHLYFWKERNGSRYLHKEAFKDWGEAFEFVEKVK